MSNGLEQLLHDLETEHLKKFDVQDILSKYHLTENEEQILKSRNENDLKKLGLKKEGITIVASYNHSCLCGPHTLPTWIKENDDEKLKN